MASRQSLPALLNKVLGEMAAFFNTHEAGTNQLPSLDLWLNLMRVIEAAGTVIKSLPKLILKRKKADKTGT